MSRPPFRRGRPLPSPPPPGQATTLVRPEFLTQDRFVPRQDVVLRLLLYDFVTGNEALLEQHRQALNSHVLRSLSDGSRVNVFLGGLASRVYDSDFNEDLARARAMSVATYLERAAPAWRSDRALVVRSYGERMSVKRDDDNSPQYRSVLVVVSRLPPPPPPPPPPQRPPPIFDRFRIALGFGYEGGGLGVALGVMRFIIDYDTGVQHAPASQETRYKAHVAGLSIGGPAGAAEGMGVWNAFDARRNCTPQMFEGSVHVEAWGASFIGGVGGTEVTLRPDRGPPIEIPNFRTGPSVQLGIGEVQGPIAIDR